MCFATPTLAISGSDSMMLLFMNEKREHWTREDGNDSETLTISVAISESDLQTVSDRYWHIRVTNFDQEHPATSVLTIAYAL